jgi:hypothetical protein
MKLISFTPTISCPFECVARVEKEVAYITQPKKKHHVECKGNIASQQLKRTAKK